MKLKIERNIIPHIKKVVMEERHRHIDIYWSYNFEKGSYGELMIPRSFLISVYYKNIEEMLINYNTNEVLEYRNNTLRLLKFLKRQNALGYIHFIDNINQDDFRPYIIDRKVNFKVSGYLEKIYKNENNSFAFLNEIVNYEMPIYIEFIKN